MICMNLEDIFADKELKNKKRTETIAVALESKTISVDDLISFSSKAKKDTIKATCMEALEYTTQNHKEIASLDVLNFARKNLYTQSPRLKWESARVIGNIAGEFPNNIDAVIKDLIANVDDDGTVVRWSIAYALSSIYSIPKYATDEFALVLKDILNKEEKDSIKKIYKKALKIK